MAKNKSSAPMPDDYISVGNVSTTKDKPAKKQSVKTRGTGAATKGTKSSDKLG